MALLINIDTATETASVCVSLEGNSLAVIKSQHQKEHASFIHGAIEQVLNQTSYSLQNIDAFAVTSGPGSYTGLRVAMATAKGFCYALSKPLITENTLKVMAKAALNSLGEGERDVLLCPMIDARRMEVFTALYNCSLENWVLPVAMVLSEGMFDKYRNDKEIIFFGNGSRKFTEIEKNSKSIFKEIEFDATHLGELADESFKQQLFSDVSYSQPSYFKDFHFPKK